jgi:hypothetical protein
MIRRIGLGLIASGLFVGLAGCSSSSSPPAPLCPKVGIISGLEHEERTAADGQSIYRAAMENVDGACQAEGGDLLVEIAIDVVVQPGPALTQTLVELPYFVAVSEPGGSMLDRQDYVARVEVPRGARRAGVTETFRQRFLGREAGASGYEVLFGLSLPEAEAMRQYRGG